MGGWPGGLSETGNKAISTSIEVEVELSSIEAELGNFVGKNLGRKMMVKNFWPEKCLVLK